MFNIAQMTRCDFAGSGSAGNSGRTVGKKIGIDGLSEPRPKRRLWHLQASARAAVHAGTRPATGVDLQHLSGQPSHFRLGREIRDGDSMCAPKAVRISRAACSARSWGRPVIARRAPIAARLVVRLENGFATGKLLHDRLG